MRSARLERSGDGRSATRIREGTRPGSTNATQISPPKTVERQRAGEPALAPRGPVHQAAASASAPHMPTTGWKLTAAPEAAEAVRREPLEAASIARSSAAYEKPLASTPPTSHSPARLPLACSARKIHTDQSGASDPPSNRPANFVQAIARQAHTRSRPIQAVCSSERNRVRAPTVK